MATLGLVLGGGGARGLAHVGALRALADVDLAPDVVVGVSMGAVVGATYAAREDWYDVLRGFDTASLPGHEPIAGVEGVALLRAVIRSAVDIAPKLFDFGRSGGFEVFGRETMAELLDGSPSFAELRLPFAAVATDISGGRRAVLDSGDVTEAVMASSALPVLTRPLVSGAASYMDGGFADPAPIDVARAMGADVVVMVHVGAPPTPEPAGEAEDSPIAGMLRGLEVGLQAFVETRLAAADLLVAPTFPDGVSWLSFNRADELAALGHQAMRDKLPALTELLSR